MVSSIVVSVKETSKAREDGSGVLQSRGEGQGGPFETVTPERHAKWREQQVQRTWGRAEVQDGRGVSKGEGGRGRRRCRHRAAGTSSCGASGGPWLFLSGREATGGC